MLTAVLMTVFCIFAVYGAVRFVFFLYGYFFSINNKSSIKRHTVIFLKNNENEAETLIRTMAFERNPVWGELVAVLRGSSDETIKILRRLEKEYEFLHVMDMEEYISFIEE